MAKVIYNTAATLNGFLADENNSLEWLFAVEEEPHSGEPRPVERLDEFLPRVGAVVMGSTTYQWVLDAEGLVEHPERWGQVDYLPSLPVFVFTSRLLPRPAGADVRFVGGDVAVALAELLAAAGGRDIWLMGGGDLAGQFDDAGLLDEVRLDLAPALLPGGAALFPRRLGPERLRLRTVEKRGQFVGLVYTVLPPTQ